MSGNFQRCWCQKHRDTEGLQQGWSSWSSTIFVLDFQLRQPIGTNYTPTIIFSNLQHSRIILFSLSWITLFVVQKLLKILLGGQIGRLSKLRNCKWGFKLIQSAIKIFFRQIATFVLISLSNQRIFTRKISISKKLVFPVKSQHYNIVCNSKITLEIREILLGYQVVGDTPKTKSCINTRIWRPKRRHNYIACQQNLAHVEDWRL